MKQPIKIPFGLNKSNVLVHISDVESGKKCGCICPACKSPLIASKKGRQRQEHFKHAAVIECEGAFESAVHLAAKKIITERKQLTLSQYLISVSKKDSRGREYTAQKTIVKHGTNINFDSVEEEVELQGMRADILAKKGAHQLIVEIFYRHKVDDQKREKITENNLSAIEINLSNLLPRDVQDWEAFWLYINDPQHIQWLHNAKAHHADYPELEKQVTEKIQEQEEKYKQEEIEAQERAQKELVSFPNDLKGRQRKEYPSPDNRPLLYRPSLPQRRGPPLIDLVHPSSGRFTGTQRPSSYRENRTFGRKKK